MYCSTYIRARSGNPEDGFPAIHTVLVSDSRRRSGDTAAMARVISHLPFKDAGDTSSFTDNYGCQPMVSCLCLSAAMSAGSFLTGHVFVALGLHICCPGPAAPVWADMCACMSVYQLTSVVRHFSRQHSMMALRYRACNACESFAIHSAIHMLQSRQLHSGGNSPGQAVFMPGAGLNCPLL